MLSTVLLLAILRDAPMPDRLALVEAHWDAMDETQKTLAIRTTVEITNHGFEVIWRNGFEHPYDVPPANAIYCEPYWILPPWICKDGRPHNPECPDCPGN
jgi:hypothetical protein